jgi:hypothetical protein
VSSDVRFWRDTADIASVLPLRQRKTGLNPRRIYLGRTLAPRAGTFVRREGAIPVTARQRLDVDGAARAAVSHSHGDMKSPSHGLSIHPHQARPLHVQRYQSLSDASPSASMARQMLHRQQHVFSALQASRGSHAIR